MDTHTNVLWSFIPQHNFCQNFPQGPDRVLFSEIKASKATVPPPKKQAPGNVFLSPNNASHMCFEGAHGRLTL